ncbi:DUF5667 domain-containing protein [Streptomyces sp. NPDC051940]|uniref:DUF5667 domain-containing protein n=1 Tax=Streptomyces sp. NPDC051940 TaxID=3155675 RepID=UPI0034145119
MIGSVSAQANAFAQALEEPIPPEALAADPEQTQLLALAGGLAALPAPELSAEVKTEQRALLIAEMERMFAGGGAGTPAVPEQRRRGAHRATRSSLSRLRPRSRWSRGVAIGGLGVGVAAGAFSGAAAASSDALPGDTLYGLKRGMEDFRLSLADGDSERGKIYLDQASTRLNEARRLMERDRAGELDEESVSEVRRALSGVKHDAGEGRRLLARAYESNHKIGPMRTLSEFSERHRGGWSELRARLPQQLSGLGEDVTRIFDDIEQDLAPHQNELPPESSPGGAPPGTTTRDDDGSPGPSPSATTSADATTGASGTPAPSDSASDGGLLGDGILGGNTGSSSSPDSSGSPSTSPEADITLPPLLPGLLPGLGISGEEE